MEWMCESFDALGSSLLYRILAARNAVFVVEQQCPYQDIDGRDPHSLHLVAQVRDAADALQIAAYLRLLPPGVAYDEASIGRVITAASHRGTGLGRELLARAVAIADEAWPLASLRIGAQAHLEAFYGAFGFVKASEPYDEDGILHIEMLRPPAASNSTTLKP
ncbi:GNAT family N-acetyltransferase [Pandoraea cepalis]|uniref:GNAT family N-acetyltransferase n=1 Tax=Pandoraea cepalis TaxID=2508294 RepID=A0AAW7MM76_9BURK|nr:GNAT family N-acetyltransferase [Pandoraea cepalis]MDN4573755.1 GNAT family N-acetyltransferase [Pandoraea cepalis]MDN4578297.1 GNAT family N-acetyltransferase [Pandoraea cepalis]